VEWNHKGDAVQICLELQPNTSCVAFRLTRTVAGTQFASSERFWLVGTGQSGLDSSAAIDRKGDALIARDTAIHGTCHGGFGIAGQGRHNTDL
jgi:hypothetical protein